jgi:hypothetical protein
MPVSRVFIGISLTCYVIGILTDIAVIFLASMQIGACDIRDFGSRMTMQQYLMGGGIADLILSIITIGVLSYTHHTRYSKSQLMIFPMTFNVVFSVIWCILGGIIIFGSNMKCLSGNSIYFITAVSFWSVTILKILRDYTVSFGYMLCLGEKPI